MTRLLHSLPLPAPMRHAPAAFDLPAMGGGPHGTLRYFSIPWTPLPEPVKKIDMPGGGYVVLMHSEVTAQELQGDTRVQR